MLEEDSGRTLNNTLGGNVKERIRLLIQEMNTVSSKIVFVNI